ncbi:MAG: hypothetical protein RIG63_07130 [Coleofasciculus chthonoplastes F3-SA18-01]|uniref:hypothetical protein n=1 Tax=Coleofasciculus chthonoplastes TaxID=64178 RepID=UPI003303E75D
MLCKTNPDHASILDDSTILRSRLPYHWCQLKRQKLGKPCRDVPVERLGNWDTLAKN